jgi:hypothetical protein
MTSQEFEAKYKVLKQIAGGAGQSFTAQHRSSGRAVLVHVLAAAAGEEVASLVERLPPRDRAKVLDSLVVDDSPVFVTQVLEGFQTFEGWLRGRAASATGPTAGPAEAPPPPMGGGGFTELFRPPDRPQPSVAPPEAPPDEAPSAFTALFRAAERAAPSPEPPRPPSPSVPPLRVVGLRLPKPHQQADHEPAPPPLRPNLSGDAPPPATPLAPPQSRAPGQPIIMAPDSHPVSPPPRPAWSGPSDFTRQLERGPQLGSDVPAVLVPPEPPAPPNAPKHSMWLLLLATNLISMLVAGLIVYFVFR